MNTVRDSRNNDTECKSICCAKNKLTDSLGDSDGDADGLSLGDSDGDSLGISDGLSLGDSEGESLGCSPKKTESESSEAQDKKRSQ